MIVYHGSTVIVEKPQIIKSAGLLDFGRGFYVTERYEQAERWTRVKMRREMKTVGYVSAYEFDMETSEKELVISRFDAADERWLDFVAANRRGAATSVKTDMHIGPVADDNVYATIRLFETGVLDVPETIKRLKTEVLHNQLTFHTDAILNYCRFMEAKEIR